MKPSTWGIAEEQGEMEKGDQNSKNPRAQPELPSPGLGAPPHLHQEGGLGRVRVVLQGRGPGGEQPLKAEVCATLQGATLTAKLQAFCFGETVQKDAHHSSSNPSIGRLFLTL